MIGDTPYDAVAASGAGFAKQALLEAGRFGTNCVNPRASLEGGSTKSLWHGISLRGGQKQIQQRNSS